MTKRKHKRAKVLPWEDLSALSKVKRSSLPEVAKSAEQLHDHGIVIKKLLVQIGIVSLFAMAVFFLSLFGKFVFMDHLLIGPFESATNEPQFFSRIISGAVLSPFDQSWLKTTFALDISSFGHIPFWYHTVNVILHVVTCIYFYLLIFRLGRLWVPYRQRDTLPYNIALAASLLLACHPLVAESVAYISGRAGVLIACNLFLTLNLFLFGLLAKRTAYVALSYIACCFTILMGVQSGPEALAIPIMMFLLVFMVKPAATSNSDWFDQKAGEMSVTALLSIALSFVARLPFRNIFNNDLYMPPLSYSLYLASQFKGLFLYYLRSAIWPLGLSVEPAPFVAHSWYDPGTICGALTLAALIYLTYRLQKQKFLVFALALLIVGFLPSLLIVRNEYGADRRFYVSIAGLAVAAGYWLANRWTNKKIQALTIGATVLVVLTGLTIWREVTWLSEKRLWLGTIASNPDSTRARARLAMIELNAGQMNQAAKDAERLVHNDPTCQPAYIILGQIDLDKNDWKGAKQSFAKALDLAKHQGLSDYAHYQAKLGLAEALVNLKDYSSANKLCHELISVDRKSPKVNLLMGKTLIGLKQPLYALSFLEIAYEQDRSFKYLEPLDRACLDTGIAKFVRGAYHGSQLSSQISPSVPISLIYGQAALELNRASECATEMEKVLNNPSKYVLGADDRARVLYLYALAEKELGRDARSQELMTLALKSNPKVQEELKITMLAEDQKSGVNPTKGPTKKKASLPTPN